jgi:hypothetical protein
MFYADGRPCTYDEREMTSCVNDPDVDIATIRTHRQAISKLHTTCPHCGGVTLPVWRGPDGVPHVAPERHWKGKTVAEFKQSRDPELLF